LLAPSVGDRGFPLFDPVWGRGSSLFAVERSDSICAAGAPVPAAFNSAD